MKAMVHTFRQFLVRHVRFALLCVAVLVASLLLYGRHLGSLTYSAVSSNEIHSLASYSSLHAIINNPLHAPLKLVAWALWHLPWHNPASLRAPFALFALFSLLAMAYTFKRWYGTRMAVFGVVLVGCSSLLLHIGRLATFDVSFLWASASLVALHLLFHAHSDRFLVRHVWVIGMLALLFVPGMVWLILANVALQREDVAASLKDMSSLWEKVAYPLCSLIVLGGISYAVYRHPHIGLEWLGAPPQWTEWQGMLKRLGDTVAYFIIRGPHQPELWLGRLPLLDAFGTIMLIAGVIFYSHHLRSFRTILIGTFLAIEALLMTISALPVSLLVPLVFAIIVGGMAYVLHQWLRVFPRNPLARGVGISLMGLLVVATSTYSLRSYFIAWPHNTETRATFTTALASRK